MSKSFLLPASLLATALLISHTLLAQTTGKELQTLVAEVQARTPSPLLARNALSPRDRVNITTMVLAPDGSKVGYLLADGTTRHLLLHDTVSGRTETLLIDDRLQQLQWTADSKSLLLTMRGFIALFPLNSDSQPRYLYRLDAKRKQKLVGAVMGAAAGQQPRLLIASTENGTTQLVLADGQGNEQKLYQGKGTIKRAVADDNAQRVFLQINTGTTLQILVIAAQKPHVLLQCKVIEICELDAYDQTSGKLWVRQDHDSDLLSLYSIDPASGQPRLESEDPVHLSDLQHVCYDSNQPRVAHYQDSGWRAVAIHGVDANSLALLQRQFADSTFTVAGCSETHWLLREESARLQRPRYHLFDTASKRITLLYHYDSDIDPQHLTDKNFVQYTASDGMLLNGYLSLPSAVALAQAPLVALIHGGPNGHAVPAYEEMVQLLTNRGYIVFEPNFRASTGFGQRYMLAANKDFGNGRVQQDMLDGLDWLLAHGIGDRNRQAIVGGSFGGFAVLTALAYTPTRFLTGVAMVPPADFSEIIRLNAESPDGQDPDMTEFLRELILDTGNPAEVAALYRRSPMAALSAVEAPLLIMAGGADHRVDIRHVRKFTSQLLMARKPVSLLVDEHEGHGFVGADAVTAQLYLVESFLAAQLHGRVEPLHEENLVQYLQRNLLVNQTPAFAPIP